MLTNSYAIIAIGDKSEKSEEFKTIASSVESNSFEHTNPDHDPDHAPEHSHDEVDIQLVQTSTEKADPVIEINYMYTKGYESENNVNQNVCDILQELIEHSSV